MSEHTKQESQLVMDLFNLTALCEKKRGLGEVMISYADYYEACVGKRLDYDEEKLFDICIAAIRK